MIHHDIKIYFFIFWSLYFMNSSSRLSNYWVTCADGLETLLEEELKALGVQNTERFPGHIVFKGSLENAYNHFTKPTPNHASTTHGGGVIKQT